MLGNSRVLCASVAVSVLFILTLSFSSAVAWQSLPVSEDPLVRMPGSQPSQGIALEGPNRCLNCHSGYNQAVEPGFNWMGSMMAQSARDPIYWACLTVAGQDSVWALGNPNAVDLCERCHFPGGWLGGRSDPPNVSAMSGDDFDGISCDFCHTMWDPFFEDTYNGFREGSDWTGYWDESNASNTPSQAAADLTYAEDSSLTDAVKLFAPSLASFFVDNKPKYATYDASVSGQFFNSSNGEKRASFADAAARHQMLYSRYHKSKFFCGTCHDVSNPVLANLGLSGLQDQPGGDLITEQHSASNYFHVERTFSEFMLSAYGQQGGAATNADFQTQGAPDITWVTKCQDCHMRDVTGVAANKKGVPVRPGGSDEHPQSGMPLHDMTGGNSWISYILGSLDMSLPESFDQFNYDLLVNQVHGPLTLDVTQGQDVTQNGEALLAGAERAKQQLLLAATIKNLSYDPANGALSFQVQNNTGHKLISGFPEGRRMFVSIEAKDADDNVLYSVNPYAESIVGGKGATLKGLPHADGSPALGANEYYVDELVYEVHPRSSLTGEDETFHFVLADGRYKDNRIPPKGFDIAGAVERISTPVWHGVDDPNYFTPAEYAGGYDDVSMTIAAGAAYVEVELYYQGTSREYIEFLRDEINGTKKTLYGADNNITVTNLTGENTQRTSTLGQELGLNQDLTDTGKAYIIQTDPFFANLKAWGDTIYDLWYHNHGLDGTVEGVDGILPFEMAKAEWGTPPGGGNGCAIDIPELLSASPGHTQVDLSWTAVSGAGSYNIYYDQAGKASPAGSSATTSFTDTGLTNGLEYCYKVTAAEGDCESGFSNIICAVPTNQTQGQSGVDSLVTGRYVTTGKGKNRVTTFEVANSFVVGDTVILRALVVDAADAPIPGAVVPLNVDGPDPASVISGPSGADGWAEASWTTQSPNKKGNGGTTPGSYTVTVSDVTADGYLWNGVATSTTFNLQ
jgi:hypothetical protein